MGRYFGTHFALLGGYGQPAGGQRDDRRAEFELNLEGSVWRFNNEGNRGAFEKNPEVYAPQFGGYDPVAIGRVRSVQGIP